LENKIFTWLSTELRRSIELRRLTPGNWTLVSQPCWLDGEKKRSAIDYLVRQFNLPVLCKRAKENGQAFQELLPEHSQYHQPSRGLILSVSKRMFKWMLDLTREVLWSKRWTKWTRTILPFKSWTQCWHSQSRKESILKHLLKLRDGAKLGLHHSE